MEVGKVYEIDPYIKISFGARTLGELFYAKLIGFNSSGNPVFEKGNEYVSCSHETAKITLVKEQR